MKKNILYVRNGPYKVNPNLYNLQEIGFCRALCDRGFNCDIIYYSDKNEDEVIYIKNASKVRILWRTGYKILRTGIYPQLLKKSFANQYDLIITTEYSQIMSLFWTLFSPKVVLYNGPYYNLFKFKIMEPIYDLCFVRLMNKRIYKVFNKSELASKYLVEKGFDNEKVTSLGVGLDVSKFEVNKPMSNELNRLINIMVTNKCILYVGSLDERKNFRFTLKVFERIYNIDSKIKLIVIGKGKESYIRKSFGSINKEIINNIIHIEKVDNSDLRHVYSNADVFVLPSKKEIFGMVLLEAMYFGVPVVSSSNGGANTLIKNGYDGVIIEEFDSKVWSEKILELINDNKYNNEIRKRSSKKIKGKFTWESISQRFIDELAGVFYEKNMY